MSKRLVKELSERDFDKIIEVKQNGQVSVFCNDVRSMDDGELIRFIRYLVEHMIEI